MCHKPESRRSSQKPTDVCLLKLDGNAPCASPSSIAARGFELSLYSPYETCGYVMDSSDASGCAEQELTGTTSPAPCTLTLHPAPCTPAIMSDPQDAHQPWALSCPSGMMHRVLQHPAEFKEGAPLKWVLASSLQLAPLSPHVPANNSEFSQAKEDHSGPPKASINQLSK